MHQHPRSSIWGTHCHWVWLWQTFYLDPLDLHRKSRTIYRLHISGCADDEVGSLKDVKIYPVEGENNIWLRIVPAGWLLFLETRGIETEQKETQGWSSKSEQTCHRCGGNIEWPYSFLSRGCYVWFQWRRYASIGPKGLIRNGCKITSIP